MRVSLAFLAFISFISERDGDREVYVIDQRGQNERRITQRPDTADYNGPVSPDGKYILVTSVSGNAHGRKQQFLRLPLAGGLPTPLGPPRSLLRHPAFSPDGRFLFFEGSTEKFREIFRLRLDLGKGELLTNNREGNFWPSLSPDGKSLAFVSSRDQVAEVYVLRLGEKSARRLTHTERDEWHPAWSPDGKLLLFSSDRDGADRIYLQPLDGKPARRLTKEAVDPFVVEEHAEFMPNGKEVVFVRRQRDRQDQLLSCDVLTRQTTRLLENSTGPLTEPAISSDGDAVVFTVGLGEASQLFILNLKSREFRQLTLGKGPNWHPLWANAPRSIPITGQKYLW